MKYIDDIWFTSFQGIVGIVIGEDDVTHERKAYVGIGSGTDLWKDINLIAENGCPLTPEIASKIAALLNQKEIDNLRIALQESVKLQSHYAGILNMYDGGERLKFDSADEWIERLKATGTITDEKRSKPTVT